MKKKIKNIEKTFLEIGEIKPVSTEKAVMKIESENIITFEVDRRKIKTEIKREIEELFNVKIASVKSLIKNGKKIVYVKLKENFRAIDLATKLGLM